MLNFYFMWVFSKPIIYSRLFQNNYRKGLGPDSLSLDNLAFHKFIFLHKSFKVVGFEAFYKTFISIEMWALLYQTTSVLKVNVQFSFSTDNVWSVCWSIFITLIGIKHSWVNHQHRTQSKCFDNLLVHWATTQP